MEELETRTMVVRLRGLESVESRQQIGGALNQLAGIESLAVGPNRLTVSYYPQLLSHENLQAELVKLGFTLDEQSPKAGRVHRFLDELAAENERFFGGEKPDCCTLNRRKAIR